MVCIMCMVISPLWGGMQVRCSRVTAGLDTGAGTPPPPGHREVARLFWCFRHEMTRSVQRADPPVLQCWYGGWVLVVDV